MRKIFGVPLIQAKHYFRRFKYHISISIGHDLERNFASILLRSKMKVVA